MAAYHYKSWETITLPTVNNTTFYKIFSASTATPGTSTTNLIYTGLVLAGYKFEHIEEILSQYTLPQEILFINGLQEDTDMVSTWYIYNSTDNWETFNMDTLTIEYDWSYETDYRTVLSEPIVNLLDVRQYAMWTTKSPTTDLYTLSVKIGGIEQDNYGIDGDSRYTYTYKLNDYNEYPGEFNYAYSYDFLISRANLLPGTFTTLTFDIEDTSISREYIVAHTCYQYCVYYLNQYGGWDSLLFRGKSLQTDNLSRLSYKQNYRAQSVDFNKVDYLTTIEENFELTTSYIDDTQSSKMINLLSSNRIYLHDLSTDRILPVNITDKKCEHKNYKNNNKKLVSYTVNVTSSQPKYRV